MVNKMMTKAITLLSKAEKAVSVTLMMTCFIIVTIHVVGRYFFKYPLFFAEEVSRFMFIYIVMIGMSAVLRSPGHTRVEYFINFLTSKIRNYLEISLDLLCIFFLAFVIYTGFLLVSHTFDQLSPALSISIGLIYLSAPFSAILMCLTLTIRVFDRIRQFGR